MTAYLLSLIIAVPLLGALLVLLVPGKGEERAPLVRQLGLGVSLVVFALTLVLWSRFDPTSADFQFVEKVAWIPAFGIDYHVGVDGISLWLVVLTGFLTPISLLCSWESIEKKTKAFVFFMLALEAFMIGVFLSLDLFLFYIFWDAMLIPMYFLIGVWGYDRRIYAAIKFMLYTMAGSVLMLVAILGLAYLHSQSTGAYSFDYLRLLSLEIAPATQDLVVPRLCRRLRDQGAAVPVPYVAARCARRGADSRFGDPRRRAAEDGHLRAHPLRVSAVPRRRRLLRAVHRRAGSHRHRVRGAGRDGAAGYEEAGGLFIGQPPRLRRARHLRAECQRTSGSGLSDDRPRHQHRRALPPRRHAVRAAPHAAHLGVPAESRPSCRG